MRVIIGPVLTSVVSSVEGQKQLRSARAKHYGVMRPTTTLDKQNNVYKYQHSLYDVAFEVGARTERALMLYLRRRFAKLNCNRRRDECHEPILAVGEGS